MFSAEEILDIAIRLEQNGEAIYRKATQEIHNPEFVEMLQWISREESRHAEWFENLKHDLALRPDNLMAREMQKDVFQDMIGDQSFSLKEVDFSRISGIDELIRVFIEFEEDTVLFYEMLEPFLQEEAPLRQLKKIIAEEKHHIQRLREFLTSEAPETVTERG